MAESLSGAPVEAPSAHAPPAAAPAPAPIAGGRIDALDVARGLALAAMAAYHLTWDLGYLRLTPLNAALTPAGRLAAHLIAGTFLTLAGLGLVLAHRRGFRPRPYLLRLARIGGAALLITGATALAMPDSFIFFGILHCIAVSSVLALPFLRLPVPVTALAAALVIAAPRFVHMPALDTPWLFFLGLGRASVPRTNDWVPLFPWFGLVLAGVALGRLALPMLEPSRLRRWQARGRAARAAAFAGRHSLAVYLVHQPLLFALVYGIVSLTGPNPRAGVAEFRQEFQANCTRTGGGEEACRLAAACIVQALRREKLWDTGVAYTMAQRAQAQALARQCYQSAEGTAPPP